MRLTILTFMILFLSVAPARAQFQVQPATDNLSAVSVESESPALPELPTGPDPYTVTNVDADVTADTAAHARDQAIVKAQRTAYEQLCARFKAPNNSTELSDDDVAALVQSFEVQRERVSAVRYIGVFTVHFNPSAIQRTVSAPSLPEPKEMVEPQTPVSHIAVSVQAESLMVWTQLKRRLVAVPQVTKIDMLSFGRGLIQVDVSYAGLLEDLKHAAMERGLVLRQNDKGLFDLYDSSVVSR